MRLAQDDRLEVEVEVQGIGHVAAGEMVVLVTVVVAQIEDHSIRLASLLAPATLAEEDLVQPVESGIAHVELVADYMDTL